MKKKFITLVFLLLIFSSCEKTEIKQIELKGTIKGQLIVFDEFGEEIDDFKDVNIVLEDGDITMSTNTDSAGEFLLENIPTGTYNLIFSKEGFSDYQQQGVQIVGGDEPFHVFGYLVEETSASIENISLELDVANNLYLKSTVNYNGEHAVISYFLQDHEDVSCSNYLKTGTLSITVKSGSQATSNMYINSSSYTSGSKIYIIAYGRPIVSIGYYDILSNQVIYPFGEPSNIASITIP